MMLTRRSFVSAALGSISVLSHSLRAAEYTFVQYHNQPAASPLHRRLVEMWTAIRIETRGRVDTQVFHENRNTPGSDPAVLRMLVAGEIPFFTVMCGIIGDLAPAAEVQQMPFWFRSAAHAHRAMDGALGMYLRDELAAKGIFALPVGAFDNGMRQIAGTKRPIASPDDLAGIKSEKIVGFLNGMRNAGALIDQLRGEIPDAFKEAIVLINDLQMWPQNA